MCDQNSDLQGTSKITDEIQINTSEYKMPAVTNRKDEYSSVQQNMNMSSLQSPLVQDSFLLTVQYLLVIECELQYMHKF